MNENLNNLLQLTNHQPPGPFQFHHSIKVRLLLSYYKWIWNFFFRQECSTQFNWTSTSLSRSRKYRSTSRSLYWRITHIYHHGIVDWWRIILLYSYSNNILGERCESNNEEISFGCDYMHSNELYHRYLKPEVKDNWFFDIF